MDELSIKIGPDGMKNSTVNVSGILTAAQPVPREIVTFAKLSHPPKSLKIEAIEFSFQDKLGFRLWWTGGDLPLLILPVESRGLMNFEGMQSLHSPEGVTGIGFTTYGMPPQKADLAFLLMLDLVKQP